jgi:hypothetical protein
MEEGAVTNTYAILVAPSRHAAATYARMEGWRERLVGWTDHGGRLIRWVRERDQVKGLDGAVVYFAPKASDCAAFTEAVFQIRQGRMSAACPSV